jgi:hypothetical protein
MIPRRVNAYLFIVLNIIRIISIIALLLVFASSTFTLVQDITAWNRFVNAGYKNIISVGNGLNSTVVEIGNDYAAGSTVPNQPGGPFFAVLNRLFIIFQTIVLIMAEVEYPSEIFNRFFPVLGTEFGVGALGLFQVFIGAAVLSHHVNQFTLGSAFFLFVIGCVNAIVIGVSLREKAKSKRSITSWKEHRRRVLPSVMGYTSSTTCAAGRYLAAMGTRIATSTRFHEESSQTSRPGMREVTTRRRASRIRHQHRP